MKNSEKLYKLARGEYQRRFVIGQVAFGGSDLRGKAAQYSGRYQASLKNLMDRAHAEGVHCHLKLGPRGGLWNAHVCYCSERKNHS